RPPPAGVRPGARAGGPAHRRRQHRPVVTPAAGPQPDPHADAVSWWLRDVGAGRTRPALEGDLDIDVAILGAGFTGLWTAHALQALDPTRRIAIIEADHVGFGASGRNGGWCAAGLSVSWGELARRYGPEVARRTAAVMRDTVAAVGHDCAAAGID